MAVVILAEKPSVGQEIARALGNDIKRNDGYLEVGDYLVTWAVGHLLQIDDSIAPEKWEIATLPILPEKFSYMISKGKEKQFTVVRKLLEKANEVFIGTDAGREGELIARLILIHANWNNWDKTYRIWTSEALTKEVIRREIQAKKPAKQFNSLYRSAIARMHADWIVGINLTRLVTLLAGDKSVWSVGRVQTPVLKLVVDRELEIENFKPEPYWYIKVLFSKDGSDFWGKYFKDNQFTFKEKATLEQVIKDIEEANTGRVVKVDTKEHKKAPPLLFSITTLQMTANKRFGFTAEKTLNIAQVLYEKKLISYPRTESQHLDEGARGLVKNVLKKLGREDLVSKVDKVGKRVFDNSKLTDHYAIIPLNVPQEELPDDEKKIYETIKNRFIGAFLDDYVYEITTVHIDVNGHMFAAQGKVDKVLGWKELEKDDKDEQETFEALPKLQPNDTVKKLKQELIEDQTKPPSRYTESSLLAKMKELGLGTGATRASIIETLKERFYIKIERKSIIPTDKGITLIKRVGDRDFASPEMTSTWENKLEEIRNNKVDYKDFIASIKDFTRKEIDQMKNQTFEVEKKPVCTCRCGGSVFEFRFSYICQSCGLKLSKEIFHRKVAKKDVVKLFEGQEVFMDKLKSKAGNVFKAFVRLEQDGIKLRFKNDKKSG
ncbi:MAG TPA: type IA DNA topoisomerase [Thermodesulfobium narugense]|nr:type IA DNA topoisomerase [Thermodesulfobium narugense]